MKLISILNSVLFAGLLTGQSLFATSVTTPTATPTATSVVTSVATPTQEYLIQVIPEFKANLMSHLSANSSSKVEDLKFGNWIKLNVPAQVIDELSNKAELKKFGIIHVQKNYKIKLYNPVQLTSEQLLKLAKVSDDKKNRQTNH